MTQEELDKIVEQHQHWLREDVEGWGGMRAYLTGANLTGANLTRANLTGADRFRLGKVLDESLTGYKKTKEGVILNLSTRRKSISVRSADANLRSRNNG